MMASPLTDILSNTADLNINYDGISHLLHGSICPAPMTVYDGIYLNADKGKFTRDPIVIDTQPCAPYNTTSTSEPSNPSPAQMLDLLTPSIDTCTNNTNAALMMSAGKDSVALALAAAQRSDKAQSITALTYCDADNAEGDIASQICARLGLRHHNITMPSNPATIRAALTHYFTHAPHPNCDPSVIPYVMTLHQAQIENTTIIDGTGNDGYFGLVPTRNQNTMLNAHKSLHPLQRVMQKCDGIIPFTNPLQKFLMPYPQRCFYGHAHLRMKQTAAIFEHTRDTNPYWNAIFNAIKHRPNADILGHITTRYFDQSSVMMKGAMAAAARGCDFALPWTDLTIAQYLSNLPIAAKYDHATYTNKILLRTMLHEYLDYDAAKIGKHIFGFNRAKFVSDNTAFIRDEILSCALWRQPNIETSLKQWRAQCPHSAGAIVDVFLISGWYNHCRYLNPTAIQDDPPA